MIKSNKLKKDSCGYMAQLYDISSSKKGYSGISVSYAWKKIFREDLKDSDVVDLIEDIEFINTRQKEEIAERMLYTFSRMDICFKVIGLTRIAGHTKCIKDFNGKEVEMSVDAIYEYSDGRLFGVIANVKKNRDRYKKKAFGEMGISKKTYEGYAACEYIDPKLSGVIFINMYPAWDLKENTTEEFIFAHFCVYDHLNNNETLKPIEEKLQDCSKGNNCFLCRYKVFCNESKYKEQIPLTAPPQFEAAKSYSPTVSQQEFINTIAGVIKVNAVAGSGKTTSIAARIVNLIDNGYLPEDILCISFTRTAAIEMRQKIERHTSTEISERVNIFTFHSFCQKILEANYKQFGYTVAPQIASKVDKIKILNKVIDKMPKISGLRYDDPIINMKYAKGALFQIYDYVDEYLKRGYLENADIEFDIYAIIMEMQNEMIANNLVDLNSLISWINQLDLSNYQFRHIILDEGQDTSNVQFEIIKKISKQAISLAIAGDSMQSIFSWLYLDVNNLINFNSNFSTVKEINFVENFRTTKEIAQMANKLIVNGPKIKAFKHGGAPFIKKINDYSEINDIIRFHNTLEYGTIGILARNKNLSDMLSIQYNAGAKYLFKQDIVHSITKLGEYILNGSNSECIFELLKYSNKISDSENLEEIKSMYLDKVAEIDDLKKTFSSYTSKKQLFLYLIAHYRDDDQVLQNINFDRFRTLEDIVKFLKESIMFDDDTTYITKNESNVSFSTVHSCKGCEFDTVILLLDKFDISSEESIRLLYTAITRAKTNLYLVYRDSADKIIKLIA